MFDLFARDTELAVSIAASAILIILPIQLFLCFRVEKLLIKCLPTVLFAVAAVAFYTMAITAKDWGGFVYLILAVFSGVFLIFSGIAWAIFAVSKHSKRDIKNSTD